MRHSLHRELSFPERQSLSAQDAAKPRERVPNEDYAQQLVSVNRSR